MRVKNRFYAGARDILTSGYAVETIDKAVTSARALLESEPLRQYMAIVLIRVVRRSPQPVTVEKVTA